MRVLTFLSSSPSIYRTMYPTENSCERVKGDIVPTVTSFQRLHQRSRLSPKRRLLFYAWKISYRSNKRKPFSDKSYGAHYMVNLSHLISENVLLFFFIDELKIIIWAMSHWLEITKCCIGMYTKLRICNISKKLIFFLSL